MTLAPLWVGSLLGLIALGCHGRSAPLGRSPEITQPGPEAARPVSLSAALERSGRIRAEPAVTGRVREVISVPCEVVASPDGSAVVSTTVLARVSRWHVAPGGRVRAGDAVVTLESPAVAEQRSARARALIDQSDLSGRVTEESVMLPSGATSARSLRSSQAALARAREEVASAERALSVAQASVSGRGGAFTLRSPIDGVLAAREVPLGASVMPAAALAHIIDLARLRVFAEVGESAGEVLVGARASVSLRGSAEVLAARVVWSDVTLRRSTRTRSVQLEVEGEHTLSPGQTGTLRIERDSGTSGVLVPLGAVYREGDRATVFVRESEGRYTPRAVLLGADDGVRVEVVSGVAQGEPVVVTGSFLVAGEHIRLR